MIKSQEIFKSFNEDVQIDEKNLYQEWLEFPNIYLKWSKDQSDYKHKLKRLNNKLKKYEKEIVIGEIEYQKTKNEILNIEHKLDMIENIIKALEYKLISLERLHEITILNKEQPEDIKKKIFDNIQK